MNDVFHLQSVSILLYCTNIIKKIDKYTFGKLRRFYFNDNNSKIDILNIVGRLRYFTNDLKVLSTELTLD